MVQPAQEEALARAVSWAAVEKQVVEQQAPLARAAQEQGAQTVPAGAPLAAEALSQRAGRQAPQAAPSTQAERQQEQAVGAQMLGKEPVDKARGDKAPAAARESTVAA